MNKKVLFFDIDGTLAKGTFVPQEHYEALKKLNPQPTQTVILDGCNHGNGMYKQTEVFQGAIKNFVNCHLHNDK